MPKRPVDALRDPDGVVVRAIPVPPRIAVDRPGRILEVVGPPPEQPPPPRARRPRRSTPRPQDVTTVG